MLFTTCSISLTEDSELRPQSAAGGGGSVTLEGARATEEEAEEAEAAEAEAEEAEEEEEQEEEEDCLTMREFGFCTGTGRWTVSGLPNMYSTEKPWEDA